MKCGEFWAKTHKSPDTSISILFSNIWRCIVKNIRNATFNLIVLESILLLWSTYFFFMLDTIESSQKRFLDQNLPINPPKKCWSYRNSYKCMALKLSGNLSDFQPASYRRALLNLRINTYICIRNVDFMQCHDFFR